MKKIILIIFIYGGISFCQNSPYHFDLFSLIISNQTLNVYDLDSNLIYQKKFINPVDQAIDLDGDAINEYLVTDSYEKDNYSYFTIYIFNTIDTFYLADSIYSGVLEPYLYSSEDLNSTIIITGNPKFDIFNKDTLNPVVPINCWQYEDAKVNLVNDKVYDPFMSENENIMDYLDDYFSNHNNDCISTDLLKADLSACYANYIHAGETSNANQFLSKYYKCNNVDKFKQEINQILEDGS